MFVFVGKNIITWSSVYTYTEAFLWSKSKGINSKEGERENERGASSHPASGYDRAS